MRSSPVLYNAQGGDTPPGLRVDIGHASRQGPRASNEDFVGAATPAGDELFGKGIVLAIADGVGGHAHGREAAEQTVRSLLADYYATPLTWDVAQSLDAVLEACNRWLLGQSSRAREHAGMATTLTALVLRGRRYHLAHVGDTRAYLWRDSRLQPLSEDHTWPHPEFDNVLRRAIGLETRVLIDHDDGELQLGDRFVLLSDGVWSPLGDAAIATVLAQHDEATRAADALVERALRAGGNDNASALVADVRALPEDTLRDRLAGRRRLPLPPRLKPATLIDGLRVEAPVHASRRSLLYRVTRVSDGMALILKTLPPDASDDEIAALVYEEWLARRVPDGHFAQAVEHVACAHVYILMRWYDGETLQARCARGARPTPHEIAALAGQLLRAVATLHRLGIVHRDIKPDNVHVGCDGRLRLLDLGVATTRADERAAPAAGAAPGQVDDMSFIDAPGTPSYMAPELFHGALADEASDLYACGVTLYHLLARKYPYGEIEPFQHPRFGEPVPPTRYRPDTPQWLETIVLKACARNPAQRFESAYEFLHALERGAARPLARRRRTPLVERNPRLALKIVALASLLGNVVLAYLLSRH